MLVLLVGPKGSGKSHIGRVIERELGVRFFHVEPLWMAYHARCRETGSEATIAGGIAVVHTQVRAALQAARHVCVETTGASPEILNDLLTLAAPADALVVRIHAPLDVCLARIAARDPTQQIPAEIALIEKVYALSRAARVDAAFELENVGLSDAEIVERFRRALDDPRASVLQAV